MKKTWKRLCTGFLVLATVVTALPTTPVHAESKQYWTESAERVGIIEKVMNDGSIGSTFNEGYMKVEGETAYCIDINTDFKNGYKTRADASSRMSANQISDVALSLEYVKQYGEAHKELNYKQVYLLEQCVVWQRLSVHLGWQCDNVRASYDEIPKATQDEVFAGARTFVKENKGRYECGGYIYSGEGQELGQFWAKLNVGNAKLQKTSSNNSITDGNGNYYISGATYGVFSDKDCTKQLATLTTDGNGNTDVVEVTAGTVYIKELSAPAGYKVDKTVFDEYIRVIEEEYTIDNTIEYDIYKEPNHQVQNFFQSEYYDFDPVLKLSDYNRLLELRKMPLLSLNDNEYYIVTNSKFAYEVEDNKDIETITVANKNLKLKGYDTKSYWNSITNTGRFVVVLPDKYVQGLEVSENHLIIDTKEETDAELENKIKEDMQHQLVKVDKNGEINDESYRVNVRGAEIEQQKAMVAIVASLFMYIAFILISAVGTILAVQSLSDSTKYKYRYLTLRRLGINDKSLFKTIRKQLLILFCVPAISAILCSFVMMSSLNNVYQQILGDKHLYLIYFGLNLIIFFLIYSIYWIATYIGFKRNINEES